MLFEDVSGRLQAFGLLLRLAPSAVRSAVDARGLLHATTLALNQVALAQGAHGGATVQDLYAALHQISLTDATAWRLTPPDHAFARHLAAALAHDGAQALVRWLPTMAPHRGEPVGQSPASPRLFRALDLHRQAVRSHPGDPYGWASLPFALVAQGLLPRPAPLLAVTHRQLAGDRLDRIKIRGALLERLARQIDAATALTQALTTQFATMLGMIPAGTRNHTLVRLAAELLRTPLISPALVARRSGLSLSAASRLCGRAMALGLLEPMVERASWRVYRATCVSAIDGATPGRAIAPRRLAVPAVEPDDLGAALSAIDALLAEFSAQDAPDADA